MLDLNDIRIFEKVATLRSFTAAAKALGLPKSTVSRSVARLEEDLCIRLLQRSTREVALTDPGVAFHQRCIDVLERVGDMVNYVGGLGAAPRGILRVSAGIGFGMNVLSDLLPVFVKRHPEVEVNLDLTSRVAELIADHVDVAIRMGSMPDSQLVATRLGTIHRYLCAAPAYLAQRGTPHKVEDLRTHDTVEMPSQDGRPRPWLFQDAAGRKVTVQTQPKICVNDAIAIHRLVLNGAGIGILSGYLCGPEVLAGRLAWLLPEWRPPDVQVHAVFPSSREMSPAVRAFIDFMKEASTPGRAWQNDPLAA